MLVLMNKCYENRHFYAIILEQNKGEERGRLGASETPDK